MVSLLIQSGSTTSCRPLKCGSASQSGMSTAGSVWTRGWYPYSLPRTFQ